MPLTQARLAESEAALREAARRAAEAGALLQTAKDDLAAALAEAAAAREKSEAEGAERNSSQVLEVGFPLSVCEVGGSCRSKQTVRVSLSLC